jgi:hypothetical protein
MRWRIALATLALFGCSLHALGQQRDVQRPDGSTIAASQIDESVKQLMQRARVTGVGIAFRLVLRSALVLTNQANFRIIC